jgi:hypothetical protein
MKLFKVFLSITVFSVLLVIACKEKEPEPDKCAGKTITLTAGVTNATKCSSDGKLVARPKGSSGFTYQLNSAAFQADSTFSNLGAGNYTITVKDADGCTKSSSFTITEGGTKGPLFSAVTAVVSSKCNGGFCHGTGSNNAPTGALNSDCNIIARKALINTKVLGAENMGSLGTADKKKISDWIAAGGRYTD